MLAIALIAAVVYQDVKPWSDAVGELSSGLESGKLPAILGADPAFANDRAMFEGCKTEDFESAAWRDCLVKILPKQKSELGILVAVGAARAYLDTHDEDAALRAAAMGAIERNVALLKREKPTYAAFDNLASAMQSSYIARVIYQPRLTRTDGWETAVSSLEALERSIVAPDLFDAQTLRRLDLMTENDQLAE